jgi:hypothetical protein
MSSAVSGIVTGAFGLIVLEAVLAASNSSNSGVSKVASLLAYPGQLAANWMSPGVPLVPNLAGAKTTSASTTAAPAAATTTALATLAQPA